MNLDNLEDFEIGMLEPRKLTLKERILELYIDFIFFLVRMSVKAKINPLKARKIAFKLIPDGFVYSEEDCIEIDFILGFINSLHEPLMCVHCGSKDFTFMPTQFIYKPVDDITETREGTNLCKKCNETFGYWSYGHWMR